MLRRISRATAPFLRRRCKTAAFAGLGGLCTAVSLCRHLEEPEWRQVGKRIPKQRQRHVEHRNAASRRALGRPLVGMAVEYCSHGIPADRLLEPARPKPGIDLE